MTRNSFTGRKGNLLFKHWEEGRGVRGEIGEHKPTGPGRKEVDSPRKKQIEDGGTKEGLNYS